MTEQYFGRVFLATLTTLPLLLSACSSVVRGPEPDASVVAASVALPADYQAPEDPRFTLQPEVLAAAEAIAAAPAEEPTSVQYADLFDRSFPHQRRAGGKRECRSNQRRQKDATKSLL